MGTITGHCVCGAVQITIKGAHEQEIGACHCRMCQRWSGGLFVCFQTAPEAIAVSGPVSRHQSSSFAERAFCTTCGSHLWMRDTDQADAPYDVMPGLFDAARGWPLRSEIYSDQVMAAIRLEGAHRRIIRADYENEHPHVEGET